MISIIDYSVGVRTTITKTSSVSTQEQLRCRRRLRVVSGKGTYLLTLIRRRPGVGQGVKLVGISMPHSSRRIRGLTCSYHRFGGIKPFSRILTALTKPASPLAPSKWPIFVLIEPTSRGWPLWRTVPKVAPMAAVSRGSPAAVPV